LERRRDWAFVGYLESLRLLQLDDIVLRWVFGRWNLLLFDFCLFVYFLVPLDVILELSLQKRLYSQQLFFLLGFAVQKRHYVLVVETQIQQSQGLPLVGYQVYDILFILVHLFRVKLGQS